MTKRIGIVGWGTGENSFGVSKPYLNYFKTYGEVFILGPNEEVDSTLDLLILPGGKDVNPLRYGQIPSLFTGYQEPLLEYFDVTMLPRYIEQGVPIFGICRG